MTFSNELLCTKEFILEKLKIGKLKNEAIRIHNTEIAQIESYASLDEDLLILAF